MPARSGRANRQRMQQTHVEVVGVNKIPGLADSRPPLEHGLQGDAAFESRQWRAKAVVDAMTECDGLAVWAVEAEPVRLRERFGVPVGGREYQQYGVARPDGVITSSDVLQRQAPDELVWSYQAHQLLDRRRPAGGLAPALRGHRKARAAWRRRCRSSSSSFHDRQ